MAKIVLCYRPGGPQSQVTIFCMLHQITNWSLAVCHPFVLTVWRWQQHFWKFVDPCFRLKCLFTSETLMGHFSNSQTLFPCLHLLCCNVIHIFIYIYIYMYKTKYFHKAKSVPLSRQPVGTVGIAHIKQKKCVRLSLYML